MPDIRVAGKNDKKKLQVERSLNASSFKLKKNKISDIFLFWMNWRTCRFLIEIHIEFNENVLRFFFLLLLPLVIFYWILILFTACIDLINNIVRWKRSSIHSPFFKTSSWKNNNNPKILFSFFCIQIPNLGPIGK